MEETEQWLDFDHEKFEGLKVKDGEESWFQGFLNMSVTNDCGGGNQERTVVTFDTHGHGGNPMNVQAEAFPEDYDFSTDKIKITLCGSMEAASFFSAMENLVHCYKLKRIIGS
jgi:hypothetical protein